MLLDQTLERTIDVLTHHLWKAKKLLDKTHVSGSGINMNRHACWIDKYVANNGKSPTKYRPPCGCKQGNVYSFIFYKTEIGKLV